MTKPKNSVIKTAKFVGDKANVSFILFSFHIFETSLVSFYSTTHVNF